jgi:hypothetical protein
VRSPMDLALTAVRRGRLRRGSSHEVLRSAIEKRRPLETRTSTVSGAGVASCSRAVPMPRGKFGGDPASISLAAASLTHRAGYCRASRPAGTRLGHS